MPHPKDPSFISYQLYFGTGHPDGAGSATNGDGTRLLQRNALCISSGCFIHVELIDRHGHPVACSAESPSHLAYFFRRVAALAKERVLGRAELVPECDSNGIPLTRLLFRTVDSGETLVLEIHEPLGRHHRASHGVWPGRSASIARPVDGFADFLLFAASSIRGAYEANGDVHEMGGGPPWGVAYKPLGDYYDRDDCPLPTTLT